MNSPMLTYAQNFEDVMLARLFDGQPTGFYIDIGASDPYQFSVTRYFYDRNWHGINVEPIPALCERLKQVRPRDINLCMGIDDRIGSRRFFEVPGYDGLSTFDAAQADYLRTLGYSIAPYDVPTLTADRLFETYVDGPVDFLKIDVEGLEATVLRSLDLTRHRPRVLLIESTPPGRPFPGWDRPPERDRSWEAPVLAAGYDFAYFDGLNSFYVRAEDRALGRRLQLPPGVFDDIKWPAVEYFRLIKVELEAAVARRDEDLAAARANAADLRNAFDRLAQDVNAQSAVAEQLRQELALAKSMLKTETDSVGNLQRSLAEKDAAVEQLTAHLQAWQHRGLRARMRELAAYTLHRIGLAPRR